MSPIIKTLRKIVPLSWRIKFGPYVAHAAYIYAMHVDKKKPKPKILSIQQTLQAIKNKRLSVIRFGDGEMSAIQNLDLGFQAKDPRLAARLKEILQTNNPTLLICILNIFDRMDYLTKKAFRFELHHAFRHGSAWRKMLSYEQTYGDAFITRPYLMMRDKSKSGTMFEMLFSIWESCDVVLIEGEKSRLGVGNDMFSKTKSLQRVLCPAENAFSKYAEILDASENAAARCAKDGKNPIFLLSVGPTAKVLAYDLWKKGHRVLDIGHIDMEYEMFLRNKTELVKVEGKYFSEIGERDPEDCADSKYLAEIVATIR